MDKELYHYTKVETLDLILKSKKFRFNSLSQVDDLEEKFTADMNDYGKHCFVSCFTDYKYESIPIWYMYAKGGQGVRLGFKGNLFEMIRFSDDIKNPLYSYQKDNKVLVVGSGIAYPVEYTDETDKLYPSVWFKNGDEMGHNTTVLGKWKRTAWKFQKEWRYSVLVYAYVNVGNKSFVDPVNVPFNYFDIPVKQEVFNNMEITLGYNLDENNRRNVKEWVDDYNNRNKANITVNDSKFLNKIK